MNGDNARYSFGYWIKRRRKALDLTQRELAERVGCAVVTLKKIEADARRPSVVMAERLALELRVPATEQAAFVAVARGERPVDTLSMLPAAGAWHVTDLFPGAAGRLIGRETELAQVCDLLGADSVRMVTLAGPGGIGKTRLALAVAAELARRRAASPHTFPAGIVLVDLAAVDNPNDIMPSIASSMKFEPDSRPGAPPLVDQLTSYLRDRDLLLILDNAEQLVGATRPISALLQHTTRPTMLVTSRQRLGSAWEYVVPLKGLSYPEGGQPDPATYPSGQLFLERARQHDIYFTLQAEEHGAIAQLCQLLDGTPLALELAAAWTGALRIGALLENLRSDPDLLSNETGDRPARHQGFRAIWQSTWERLDVDEQGAYARLSVFRGGFRRPDAEAVAGVSPTSLNRLTSQFLLSLDRSTGRYRLHELLRQYAEHELSAAGAEQTTRLAHLQHFRELANAEERRLHGRELEQALRWFDLESDNLAASLTYALSRAELTEDATELLSAWSWSWRIRSQVARALGWLERLHSAAGHSHASRARTRYLMGHFTWMSGDFTRARKWLLESQALWEQLDREGHAHARHEAGVVIHHLGMTAMRSGEPGDALRLFEHSRSIFAEEDNAWWLAFSYSWAPLAHYALGDADAAEAAMASYRTLSQSVGDRWLDSLTLTMYAETALQAGSLALAYDLVTEALALQRAVGHTHSQGHSLLVLGEIAREQGDLRLAARRFREAGALFESLGNQRYLQIAERQLATLERDA